jgi:hypothetical protein
VTVNYFDAHLRVWLNWGKPWKISIRISGLRDEIRTRNFDYKSGTPTAVLRHSVPRWGLQWHDASTEFQENSSFNVYGTDVTNFITGQMDRYSGHPWKYHNKIHDYILKYSSRNTLKFIVRPLAKVRSSESEPGGSADPVHDWMIHCVPASPLTCFLCHGLMDMFPLRVVIAFLI